MIKRARETQRRERLDDEVDLLLDPVQWRQPAVWAEPAATQGDQPASQPIVDLTHVTPRLQQPWPSVPP